MDIYSTRRARFRQLISEEYGSNANFCKITGAKKQQVSNWLNSIKITEKAARKIEAMGSKPIGWLDGYDYARDGIDEHMKKLVKITAEILQTEQQSKGFYFDPSYFSELFVAILNMLTLAQKMDKYDQMNFEETVRKDVLSMLPIKK